MEQRSAIAALLVGCLGAGSALAVQVDVPVERKIRSQERKQKSIEVMTAQTSGTLHHVGDELVFNRLYEPESQKIKKIHEISDTLILLSDAGRTTRKNTNMPWVANRLADGRITETASRQEILREASMGQDYIIGKLTELLLELRRTGGTESSLLRKVIEKQVNLKSRTGQMKERLLGRPKDDLRTREQVQLDVIAKEQRDLEQDLIKAIEQLKQQAREIAASDSQTSESLQQTAEYIEQAQAGRLMQKAGDQVERNQTFAGEQTQQEILDILTQAEKRAQGDQDPPDGADEPDTDRKTELQDLIDRQQAVLDNTQQLGDDATQQEFNNIQVQQAGVQNDLDNFLAPSGDTPPPSAPSQPDQGQGQEPDQIPGLGQAVKDLQQAQTALGAQAKGAATGAMKSALANLQAAQGALPGQGQEGQPVPGAQNVVPNLSKILTSVEYDAGAGQLLEGKRKETFSNQSWQVKLEDKERAVLTGAARQAYPKRYERWVSRYYRTLAQSKRTGDR